MSAGFLSRRWVEIFMNHTSSVNHRPAGQDKVLSPKSAMLPSCPSYPVLSFVHPFVLRVLPSRTAGNRFTFTVTISIELRQQTLDSDLRLTVATKYNYDGLRVACSMEISWWPYRRQTKDEGWGRAGLGDDRDGSDASRPLVLLQFHFHSGRGQLRHRVVDSSPPLGSVLVNLALFQP